MSDPEIKLPEPGIGLCLSGGGYRAMVFHTGVLWRLHDLGILYKLDRVSSVSGGSIAAACLGLFWDSYRDNNGNPVDACFEKNFVRRIRRLASHTIDVSSTLVGAMNPFSSVGEEVAKAYRKHLFDVTTLQDLPDAPRFVINASNLQSGVLWRFSKPYARDWKVGSIVGPQIELADAVAASSAFPPILSPAKFHFDPKEFESGSGGKKLDDRYRKELRLTDGGVYDNLGLETVFKRYDTVLVSNAGMGFAEKPKVSSFWPTQLRRVLDCIDNQVRSLRVRELISAFKMRRLYLDNGHKADDWFVREGSRSGAYWGIDTPISSYLLPDGSQVDGLLDVSESAIDELAHISTRLAKMDNGLQERLINWGYAACDAAIRTYYDDTLPPPTGFPYPKNKP